MNSLLRNGIFSSVGASFAAIMAMRFQKTKEENTLFLEYRPEVALSLGKPVDEVSAKEWEYFKSQNPLLQQADKAMRFSAKDWATVLVSAFVGGGAAGEAATRVVKKRNEGSLKADGSKIAGSVAGMLGGAFIGSQARKVVYDHSLESRLQNTAHGLLMDIKEKVLAGEKIAPSEVMALQVSVNDTLIAPHVLKRGHEGQEEKLRQEYPELMQQNAQLAEALNNGQLRPHQLIFALGRDGQWNVGQVLQDNRQGQVAPATEAPAKEWGLRERQRETSRSKESAGMAM